jgi:hypothetical protein
MQRPASGPSRGRAAANRPAPSLRLDTASRRKHVLKPMAAVPSVRDVALDPEWLPHAFDGDGQHLTSVFVPRDARAGLVFLSDGHYRGDFRKATFPTDAVASEAAAAEQAPLHFIFNTSFCCSTLLAKALEVPGISASLMEPSILVKVAERLIRDGAEQNALQLELALRLLERPLGRGETMIVKSSNFANRLVEPVLALHPESRAVLLYSDAGTFLRSILKRGLVARINARKLYSNLAAWTLLEFGFSDEEIFQQSDLQIAGLAWLMQIAHFQSIADRLGHERVIVVDAADLLGDPATTLQRVEYFFGLNLDERQVARIVGGPVFSKHSKSVEVDYSASARERDHEALMEVHGEELGMVVQWLEAVANHIGVALRPAVPSRTGS